jgi:hypothetical protein
MAPSAEAADVLEPVPLADAPSAYPLKVLSYGAVAPLKLEADVREDYAAFLDYAAGAGQQAGSDAGRLPAGYVPLAPALASQATAAAATVRTISAPVPAPISTTPPAGSASPGGAPAASPAPVVPRRTTNGSPRTVTAPVPEPAPPATDVPVTSDPPQASDIPAPGEEQPSEVPAGSPRPTPVVGIAASRLAVPVLGGLAMVAGLAALELTKRPRRRAAAANVVEIEAA